MILGPQAAAAPGGTAPRTLRYGHRLRRTRTAASDRSGDRRTAGASESDARRRGPVSDRTAG
eukprot:397496-Hanusia_phi.AAC.2